MRQASLSALQNAWAASGRGRKPSPSLSRLSAAARASVGLSSPAYESILRSKIRILQLLNQELDTITQLLVQECRKRTPQAMTLLNSIDGLGQVTTAHFLAETQARDFTPPKKLIAFAGLDPTIRESGTLQSRASIFIVDSPTCPGCFFIKAKEDGLGFCLDYSLNRHDIAYEKRLYCIFFGKALQISYRK